MKKDIEIRKVKDVAIAIIPKDEAFWDVFLINLQDVSLRNVIVNSRGYGNLKGENIETTTLRYFYERIPPNTSVKVEPIQRKLLDITNEFWISFQMSNYLYDKKYVFVSGSLNEMNFTTIPFHDVKGVMIK
ncbi:MAG: hypothetical protein AB8G11_05105 [Saprospiraceae bacterium]